MRTLRSASDSTRFQVANLTFLKPDFEILAVFNALGFFWKWKKARYHLTFSDFFQLERLGSGKTLSKLHIHYKFLLTSLWPCRVQRILQRFFCCPKMFNLINKKQMYDSVISRKESASKEWNCIISMFPTTFNIHFVFGYACFMCICLETAIWLFWASSGFFVEDGFAALRGLLRFVRYW